MPLSEANLKFLKANLNRLAPKQKEEVLGLLAELEMRKAIKLAKVSLLDFVQFIEPDYKIGAHHRRLANLLEDLANGVKHRIAVNIAPRFGKSHLVSYYFPAWFLGNHPDQKVMMVSHTADLAVDFGRKVRNLIASERYQAVFGGENGVELSQDSKSAGRWHTNHGGEYFAVGVGGAIAGRGADLLLIDDPHNEQDIVNGNLDVFDKAYEWFTTGARTRLMPGGRVAVVQCLVGDTSVLMADGVEKPLKDIRPGDVVSSYSKGHLTTAKVLNWANQGLDQIYTITLDSGNIIRGNERHPFLVDINGVRQWIRLRNLKPGMNLVSMRGVHARPIAKPNGGNAKLATTKNGYTRNAMDGFLHHLKNAIIPALQRGARVYQKQKQSLRYAIPALQKHLGIVGTQMPHNAPSDITVSGRVKHAVTRVVKLLRSLKGYVVCAMVGPHIVNVRSWVSHTIPINGVTSILKHVTGLLPTTMQKCFQSKTASVPYADLSPQTKTPPLDGNITSSPSIIVMRRERYADSCAIPAILLSWKEIVSTYLRKLLNTSSFTLSRVVSVAPSGVEEVFDIQVEHTENFIANGLVSHNTRWALNDLTGRVVKDMVMNEDADQYEVVEFPAVLESEVTDEEGNITVVQKSLWPEQWSLEALLKTKASMPLYQWNAQYQQNPTAEEGAIVKREWWRVWERDYAPQCDFIIQSWDTAFEKNNRADFSACTTWGVWWPEKEPNEPTTGSANIILLDSFKDRMEFPELKSVAYKHYKEWEEQGIPVSLIVEKKASGAPLIYELRAMGIPVQEYTPSKGNDKISRLNAVADLFASGMVWAPQARWAEEVMDEVASFPAGEHDDLVDATTLALMRFRQGGYVKLPSDEPDPVRHFKSKRNAGYY